MRICIAAAVVVTVLLGAIAGNAVYVHRVSEALIAELDALPDVPDPSATPADIADLRASLEKHLALLGLSVNYSLLDRAEEALWAMEAHARTGDLLQYETSRLVLRDLFRDFARLERISAENIL